MDSDIVSDYDGDDEVPELVEVPDEVSKVIPITILSGFLGSGKTTLLNYILTNADHKKRIAVIENEFSEGLGIEGLIAKSGVNGDNISNFFELNNGCICCTVKDDLVSTLEQLAIHKDRFDYILIETTGMANPGPVITSLWTDSELGTSLRLDGVVCVVDAANILYNLSLPQVSNEVRQQICYADRIIINKSDLVGPEKVAEVEMTLNRLNEFAQKKVTSFSQVDLEFILSIDSYQSGSTNQFLQCFPCCGPFHSRTVKETGTPERSVSSLSLKFPGQLNQQLLKSTLDNLLYANGAGSSNIFRIKGLLHIFGSQHLYILQSVHTVFDVQSSSYAVGAAEDKTEGLNLVIIIGCNLKYETLLQTFTQCIVNS